MSWFDDLETLLTHTLPGDLDSLIREWAADPETVELRNELRGKFEAFAVRLEEVERETGKIRDKGHRDWYREVCAQLIHTAEFARARTNKYGDNHQSLVIKQSPTARLVSGGLPGLGRRR